MEKLNNNVLNGTYLSRENTDCMKGIFALAVLFHHIFQQINVLQWYPLKSVMLAMGQWGVSVFFFISGYGLMESFQKKGRQYVKDFPKKRILPFYGMYTLIIIIYLVYDILTKNMPHTSNIVRSFFPGGGTIVACGWYLQVILLFYILFYFVSNIFQKPRKTAISMVIVQVCYFVICAFISKDGLTYQSTPAFTVGILWSVQKQYINRELSNKKKFILCELVAFVLFAVACVFGKKYDGTLQMLFKATISILFPIFIVLFFSKINIQNRLFRFLGTTYLEIYVFQGLFLSACHRLNLKNDYYYMLAVVCSTMIFSVIMHPVLQYLMKKK